MYFQYGATRVIPKDCFYSGHDFLLCDHVTSDEFAQSDSMMLLRGLI